MRSMRNALKTMFYGFCALIARVMSLFRKDFGPVVLMYHAVNTEGGKLSVSPEVFRTQMRFLKEHRSVVSMEDIVDALDGKKTLPKNAVAVTIDDGYLDTYREAFPILKEFRIPFTLFLTTNLSVLPALANLPRPTWDQVREMTAVGLASVGLHGHDHLHITDIAGDTQVLDKELGDSARLIEKEIGSSPKFYAYAFGAREKRAPAYLARIGITAAFGITDGTVTLSRDRFALPRVQIDRTMGERQFIYRTTGAVEVAFLIKRNLTIVKRYIWDR
jgi:peptidoglycan/xylan/chitin deacetylase (PgdA/CDA1 family)